MAFPLTPLNVVVEIYAGSLGWVDITADVRTVPAGGGIRITRGIPNEGQAADPGRCSLVLNNTNGKYSPRNPRSPYYGLIGRNTPIRVSVPGYGYRFWGEVSSWPPRWTTPGRNQWVPIEASGLLRRLGQGQKPLSSPIYRNLMQYNPISYLPLEDGPDTTIPTNEGVGVAAVNDMGFAAGDTLAGAAATAKLNSTGASLTIPVIFMPSTAFSVVWYFKMSSLPATDTPMMTVNLTGTAVTWVVNVASAGFSVNAVNAAGGVLASGGIGFGAFSNPTQNWVGMRLNLTESGGLTTWHLDWHGVTPDNAFYFHPGSTSYSGTIGAATSVTVTPAGTSAVSLGHVAVYPTTVPFVTTAFLRTSMGYAGETAGDRMTRLSSENGVPFTLTGTASDTMAMGPQRPDTLLNLLRECADADMGVLFESRDALGLRYRTRTSLYNQTPVQIPYGYLSPPVDPVDDDTGVRNDITVQRVNGASVRAVQTTGPVSTQAPPNGVGVYDTSVTVNASADAVLADIAGWRLHLGTVDESRYPRVGVNFASTRWAGNPALTSQATALDSGDTVDLSGLPAWLPSGTARVMVLGYAETLDNPRHWDITWNAGPGSPWDVATADGTQRVAADGSTLTAGITSSATSLQITSTAVNGPWTVDPTAFPLDINCGGERITLSAISGSTSPQTATVSARAVNGVSKAHTAGEPIDVWSPAIAAL